MEAFVTLVATDPYAAGALVLNHQLRKLGSVTNNREFVCLVTPNISDHVLDLLSKHHIHIMKVDTLRSNNHDNLQLLGRPDLDITFTKIHTWNLTQYSRVIFLDADTFPLRNIDGLFNVETSFAAAPDAGWPDCFNSGVFVATPSKDTYNELLSFASEKGSFDGGDQGLLNSYFSRWSESPEQRLPFTFNTTPTTQYGYLPAFQNYGHYVSIIHFIGDKKPWKYQRFADGHILPLGDSWDGMKDTIEAWWGVWNEQFGKSTPYQLLLSHDTFSPDQISFDTGFQTRPIESFSKPIENVWDSQEFHFDNQHNQVETMPPVATITTSEPDWYAEEIKRQQQRQREEEEERRRQEEEHQKRLREQDECQNRLREEEERRNRLKEKEEQQNRSRGEKRLNSVKEEELRNRQREEECPKQYNEKEHQSAVYEEEQECAESRCEHLAEQEHHDHSIEVKEQFSQPKSFSEVSFGNGDEQQQNSFEKQTERQHSRQEDYSTESQETEREHDQHHDQVQNKSVEEPRTYSMIEWDPAREAPPASGTVTANIPDLSSFKNVWDQPQRNQAQPSWESSIPQPNADVLASRPEYAEYRLEEYKGDAYQELNRGSRPEMPPLPPTRTTEREKRQVGEPLVIAYPDPTELGIDELEDEGPNPPEEIYYPPAFPWEAKEDHFPPPARVWLDELPHSERQRYESRIQRCNRNNYHNLLTRRNPEKQQQQDALQETSSIDQERAVQKQMPQADSADKTIFIDTSSHASPTEELRYKELDAHPSDVLLVNGKIDNIPTTLTKHEMKVIDANEPDNEPSPSSITHQDSDSTDIFALDSLIMSAKAQHKLDHFTASLVADNEDDDISARNMIPITFKPTSRLQSGFHTPVQDAVSHTSSKASSRRASVAASNSRMFPPLFFRRDSIPIINMIPDDDEDILRRPSVSSIIQEDAESVFPQGIPIENTTYATYTSGDDYVDSVMSAPIFEDPFRQD